MMPESHSPSSTGLSELSEVSRRMDESHSHSSRRYSLQWTLAPLALLDPPRRAYASRAYIHAALLVFRFSLVFCCSTGSRVLSTNPAHGPSPRRTGAYAVPTLFACDAQSTIISFGVKNVLEVKNAFASAQFWSNCLRKSLKLNRRVCGPRIYHRHRPTATQRDEKNCKDTSHGTPATRITAPYTLPGLGFVVLLVL
jgi:hypothetical protein